MLIFVLARSRIKSLEIKNTENKLTIIHSARMNPNHLIRFIQNIKRIMATMRPVMFASQMAEKDLSNHILCASLRVFPFLISSFILSKIKILASIAIPIERTSHAILASVRTIQNCFNIASVITIYVKRAIADMRPDTL